MNMSHVASAHHASKVFYGLLWAQPLPWPLPYFMLSVMRTVARVRVVTRVCVKKSLHLLNSLPPC
jgi:hypothetical protein